MYLSVLKTFCNMPEILKIVREKNKTFTYSFYVNSYHICLPEKEIETNS